MRPGKERAAVRARTMLYLPALLDHVDELTAAAEPLHRRPQPVPSRRRGPRPVDRDPPPPGTAGGSRDTTTPAVSR